MKDTRKSTIDAIRIMRQKLPPIAILVVAIAVVCFTAHAAAQQPQQELTVKQLIGSAVSDPGSRFDDVEKAITRFGNRDYDGARRHLELAKEKSPQLPPVDVTMAIMYLAARDATRARSTLEQAVTNHPDDPEAYVMLADQALAAGRVTEAGALYHFVEHLTESFDANAKRKRNFQIRTYAGNAIVAQQRKRYDVAIANLQ